MSAMAATPRSAAEVLDRLVESTNNHDLDGLVDCFAPGYRLIDPAHPARSFTGAEQVRANWRTIFAAVPDVRIEVQHSVVADDSLWLEARQVGTRRDGAAFDNQMVFIAVVAEGRIEQARIYVTPVERGGPGINDITAALAGGVR